MPIPDEVKLTEKTTKIRDGLVKNGKATNVEYMTTVDRDTGDIIEWNVKGQAASVNINKQVLDAELGGYKFNLHHNHPVSSSLSLDDYKCTNIKQVGDITAYTHDGAIYKGSAIKDNFALKQSWESARTDIRKVLTTASKQSPTSGKLYIKTQDANFIFYHLVNLKLKNQGVIRYRSTLNAKGKRIMNKYPELFKLIT